ncbi:sugar phosphate isomerase/epimerase [Dyella ginsengisoli]|uniref:Sugar phosphate isomerase/epimerase n=1 Tax=Dyella ginsengisoli TaxID=363848 RepID=A0ABW8JV70_9GAMM
MRLAISNIAWETVEDEVVATTLSRLGIDAIDIAPGKYFPGPTAVRDDDIARVRNWWATRGIEITGMQALLFGTTGLNVFGPPDTQSAMLQHLTAVARIASGLGAKRLVFGSPRNRDRTGLSAEEAIDRAATFFRRLGGVAESYGVVFCLEPNPVCYGANFMTTSAETADVVARIAHPAIRMQLDTGAITLNGEDVGSTIEKYAHLFGHVHISEPELVCLGDGRTDHAAVDLALRKWLPNSVISIEMLTAKDEPTLSAISRAIGTAKRYYQNIGLGQSTHD